ncbi:response regulator [Massilia sp. H-1]|nr:response regulator [Massilia sp. H-1]
MTVQVAGNGQEALEVLARDSRFDLILMDVQMPVLDGLAATRLIRSELKLTVPVIAMSSRRALVRARALPGSGHERLCRQADRFGAAVRHAAAPCAARHGAHRRRSRPRAAWCPRCSTCKR